MSPHTALVRGRLILPPDPHLHAERIVGAVEQTWRGEYGHHSHEIPLAVVAGLAIAGHNDPAGAARAQQFIDLDPDAMHRLLDFIWTMSGILRPDLTPRFEHLLGWLRHSTRAQHAAAHAIAVTALRHGVPQLMADPSRRHHIDLLGRLLQTLRGPAHTDRGQVYTPPAVCELMARMLVGTPQPGQRVAEPAAGTGGMLRAMAQAIRARGGDPAQMVWVAADIDPLAAGCLAVNAHLWDLGPHVLIGCGNTLADDWESDALRDRERAVRTFRVYRTIAACQVLTSSSKPARPSAVPSQVVVGQRRRVPRRGGRLGRPDGPP